MSDKKYYWIKLRETFLTSDAVDFLMGQKNGSEYVVLYQMLCLKTANTNGEFVRTIGEIIIPYDADKIQRDCKYFSIDTIHIALTLYKKLGLIYEQENGVLKIANFEKIVGKESNSNERVQRYREKQGLLDSAKIPRIEKHTNNKRYGGFYYEVLERDEYCCRNCKSQETIMVHHIIPYDPNDDDTVRKENLVTLCSSCHTSLHNKSLDKRIGLLPNKEILDAIGFDVTLQKRYDVTERDKRLEIRDKELYKNNTLGNSEPEIAPCEVFIKQLPSERHPVYKAIITYLNEKAKTAYRWQGTVTQRHINARISEGFSLEDFKVVIDKKTKEWCGGEMEKFLRPETLFGTKFEGYLNQTVSNPKEKAPPAIPQNYTAEQLASLFHNLDTVNAEEEEI